MNQVFKLGTLHPSRAQCHGTYFYRAQEMCDGRLRVLPPQPLYVPPTNGNQLLRLMWPIGNSEEVQFDDSRYLHAYLPCQRCLVVENNHFDSLPTVRIFSVEHLLVSLCAKKDFHTSNDSSIVIWDSYDLIAKSQDFVYH